MLIIFGLFIVYQWPYTKNNFLLLFIRSKAVFLLNYYSYIRQPRNSVEENTSRASQWVRHRPKSNYEWPRSDRTCWTGWRRARRKSSPNECTNNRRSLIANVKSRSPCDGPRVSESRVEKKANMRRDSLKNSRGTNQSRWEMPKWDSNWERRGKENKSYSGLKIEISH